MLNEVAGRVLVIVPAAGSGSRFGGDIPKQYRTLAGKPLLQHVVERFLLDVEVSRIIVPIAEALVASVEPMPRVQFVAGGPTRHQSVSLGLAAAGDDVSDVVAIHDAVRPFFTTETFHAAVAAAREHGAAFPSLPVADTIHVLDGDKVVMTPDRRFLFAAQTPQCFRVDVLREVLARAAREGDDASDEAGLAAKYGFDVRAVPGDSLNFKITRAEDLVMAEHVFVEWGRGN
jgi:2-C-methyl-D-erythritol 4-phosphate cytidylyltransferase